MTGIHIDKSYQGALEARLKIAEGREAVLKLAAIVGQTAFRTMTPEERAALLTPEGEHGCRLLLPEFVRAFSCAKGCPIRQVPHVPARVFERF